MGRHILHGEETPKESQRQARPRRDPGQDLDEDSGKRPLIRGSTAGGIALLVFAFCLGVGLVTLPSSTLGEKLLILLSAVALSITVAAGIGALRNGKWFAVTVVSAALSAVFVALYSIAAASRIGAGTANIPAAQAADKPSASAAPPGSAGILSVPSKPEYLADLTGRGAVWPSGPSQLAGVTYNHSILVREPCANAGADSSTYQLHGSYTEFVATVGVTGHAGTPNQQMPWGFQVYGNLNSGGSTNWLGQQWAQWHHPKEMRFSLPKGTTSLTLIIVAPGTCEDSTGVWADAKVS